MKTVLLLAVYILNSNNGSTPGFWTNITTKLSERYQQLFICILTIVCMFIYLSLFVILVVSGIYKQINKQMNTVLCIVHVE
jgi:hypothetical protein